MTPAFRAGPAALFARAVALAILIATAYPSAAPAWQGVPERPVPRVPGFDIPPRPRDPEFPLLPGAIAPLDAVPHATVSTDAVPAADPRPSAVSPRDSRTPPVAETWDRSIEAVGATSPAPAQPAAPDVSAAWLLGIAMIVILGAVAAIRAAVNVRRSRSKHPVSVVRFGPAGRQGS